jgi:hypothetical protein
MQYDTVITHFEFQGSGGRSRARSKVPVQREYINGYSGEMTLQYGLLYVW